VRHQAIWPKALETNMNNYRATAAAKLAILALAASAFAAQAQQPDLEAQVDVATTNPAVSHQSLQGVVVNGGGNALLRSDERVALLSASLPLDTGSSVTQTTDLQRVAALFPRNPNTATGEARRMMDRSFAPPAGTDADGDLPLGGR
jgi:hypothetical protein